MVGFFAWSRLTRQFGGWQKQFALLDRAGRAAQCSEKLAWAEWKPAKVAFRHGSSQYIILDCGDSPPLIPLLTRQHNLIRRKKSPPAKAGGSSTKVRSGQILAPRMESTTLFYGEEAQQERLW